MKPFKMGEVWNKLQSILFFFNTSFSKSSLSTFRPRGGEVGFVSDWRRLNVVGSLGFFGSPED